MRERSKSLLSAAPGERMLRPEQPAVETNGLTLTIWLAGPVLQLVIVAAMLARQLYRQMPIFFSYVIFHLLSFPVLFWLSKVDYTAYLYSYWAREAVGFLLGIFVIYEVFAAVFLQYKGVLQLGRAIFQWAAALSFLVAVLAALIVPGNEPERVLAAGLLLSRTVRIVQIGLMLLTMVLAAHTRLPWPHHVLGIAVGFGLYIAVDLVSIFMRGQVGAVGNAVFVVVKPGAYLLALVLWSAFMVLPEPESKEAPVAPAQLDAWDRSLQELL